jgi:cobyrinic acid a,c-diamide synthase
MKNELALKLYNRTLEIRGVELNNLQSTKFQHACEKAIVENPNLDFQGLLIATKFYLGVILDFPDSVL